MVYSNDLFTWLMNGLFEWSFLRGYGMVYSHDLFGCLFVW